MDKIKIIALGGMDESYKNMTLVEINDDIFVVEAGVKFPDRTQPGIDYIIPRHDYLIENKSKVRGYFLTQGHDSIIGAVPYIYEKVPAPIYCSATTKVFFEQFCIHNHIDVNKFDFVIVKPSQDLLIKNRKISLFGTACNIAESFGLAFNTDQGNVVFLSNFVVHNDQDKGFVHDIAKIGRIINDKTLVLLADSVGVERPGYCSPKYRLLPLVEKEILDAPGRIFFGVDTPDFFNTISVIEAAIKMGRKILAYDAHARGMLDVFEKTGFIKFNRDTRVSIEEVNRLRPQEVLVFITGYGSKLNSQIALLAAKNNDEKIVFVTPKDTFIFANHVTPENEISATETLDELYRTGCKIIRPSNKDFIRMHACEEDLKAIISLFKPQYFIPTSGMFKQLLAAAKIAVNMNIGLNHTNVFILDNGNVVNFENGRGLIAPNKVIAGDLFIDGKGVGDIEDHIIEERQRLSDDGVVIMGITISIKERKIVAGPDVQARGLVYVKDGEALIKELGRLFVSCVESELAKENFSKAYLEESVKDISFKAIRRALNKTPIIIPIIAEIE